MENEIKDPAQRPTRNMFLRILFGFLWFVLIRIVTGGFIGGIVGGLATTGHADPNAGFSGNFEAGAHTGAQAAIDFMNKYGMIIFVSQIVFFAILCYFGILPGVGKYKKVKQS
jgi:hypothetical protein